MLAVLIPELRDAFHASTADVATAIPAYLVPFALLQLVSGTIGERAGRRRAVRIAYAVYAGASLGAALAPGLGAFVACRALQGSANAFTTPLLLAGLADASPRASLGRSIGTFAGVQAGGVSFAPLIGGLVAELSWRLAFVGPALVALALIAVPPRDPEPRPEGVASFRSLLRRRVALLCACGAAGYAGMTGLGFLVSIRSADAFALGAGARGLVLAAFGAAGMVLGRSGGRAADRLGPARSAGLAAVLCGLAVAALGIAGSAWTFAVAWAAAGACSALLWAGLNTVAVEAVPANRAGTVSVFSAFKFGGSALAPLLWLPVYADSSAAAFAAAGGVVAAIAALAPLLGRA